jgi:hypothetical protein
MAGEIAPMTWEEGEEENMLINIKLNGEFGLSTVLSLGFNSLKGDHEYFVLENRSIGLLQDIGGEVFCRLPTWFRTIRIEDLNEHANMCVFRMPYMEYVVVE